MAEPKNRTTQVTSTEIEKAKEKASTRLALRDYILTPENISKFASIMGSREARMFINSVIMAVAFKPELAECSKESIVKSALRAAALELSCDESLHQAQLVPFFNKKTQQMEAKFIPHYMGLVNLAQRTGKYKTINWGSVTENMVVELNVLTGMHKIEGRPDYHKKTIGYFAYYEMTSGFVKSEYMTIEEIDQHAAKWSPSYKSDYSNWNDPKKRPYMEQKTVLRQLLKSADLSGKNFATLASALSEDVDFEDMPELAAPEPVQEAAAPAPSSAPEKKTKASEDIVDSTLEENIERPLPPVQLRQWLRAKREKSAHIPKDTERGFIAGMIQSVFAPDPDAEKIYHSCLMYIWDKNSSKQLDGPEVFITLNWLNPSKDSGGAYSPDPLAAQELKSVWYAELEAKGQGALPGMDEPK